MGKIRWFFLKMALGASLFTAIAISPARAEVSPYLEGRHPIAVPAGAKKICQTYAWACAASKNSEVVDREGLIIAKRINYKINRKVRQIEDRRQYAQNEVWALPTKRGGDCEDFALLKKRELIRAGIPADRLLIATVLDKRMRGHAVLVVRSHKGDVVLDNMTNRILSWDKTGYLFLKMQNPERPAKWDSIFAGGRLLKIRGRG